MKNVLLIISFLFAFLLGARAVNGDSLSNEKGTVESVLQLGKMTDASDLSGSWILPVSPDKDRNVMFEDAQSMARQLRLMHRNQRPFILYYTLLDKALLSKVAKSCMDALFTSSNRVYTTLPYPSWEVSSEHYIFGMRRILI